MGLDDDRLPQEAQQRGGQDSDQPHAADWPTATHQTRGLEFIVKASDHDWSNHRCPSNAFISTIMSKDQIASVNQHVMMHYII